MTSPELTHPTLLHPRTGQPLEAVGVLPNGRVVWPIMGGDGTEADANDDTGDTGADDTRDDGDQPDDSTDGDDTGTGDTSDDGDAEDKRVKRANKQAATYRQKARDAEKVATETQAVLDRLRQALDPNAEDGDKADPDKLAGQVENLTSQNQDLQRELLVHTLAPDNGADPNRLLDSRRFLTSLRELDAEADDYHDQVAKAIKDAVGKDTNLQGAGRESGSRGGAEGAGAGRGGKQGVTPDQFKAMTYAERTELYRKNPDEYRRLSAV